MYSSSILTISVDPPHCCGAEEFVDGFAGHDVTYDISLRFWGSKQPWPFVSGNFCASFEAQGKQRSNAFWKETHKIIALEFTAPWIPGPNSRRNIGNIIPWFETVVTLYP